MRNRKPKKVVWRDTNQYSFTLRYQYPLSVRNRCLFFWGTTSKGWKALLNLADRLTESNRICIVYLYGESKEELIQRHIKKLNNPKVIVLWANYISVKEIERVDKGIENINSVKKWGVSKEQKNLEIDEIFSFDYKSIIHDFFESQRKLAEDIEAGKRANENIIFQTIQNGFVIVGRNQKISAKENEHIRCLLKEIRNIYPSGAESDTSIEYAYKVLHFEKWCKAGIERDYGELDKLGIRYEDDLMEYMQLSLFDNTSFGVKEFVQTFRNICDDEIGKNGYVDLRMVFKQMQESPFGLYKCNYYGLCIGIALQKYRKGYYKSGNLFTQYTENVSFPAETKYIMDSFEEMRPKASYIYTQSKVQIELAKKMLKIFPGDWKIDCLCLENVLTNARSWFSNNVLYDTVQRIFPELFEIINLWEPCVCSTVTEKYSEWLTDEKVELIIEGIKHIDEKFLIMLSEKYGPEKAELYRKSQGMKGGAVGWLHSRDFVDERVESYMKKTVCRECGAVIQDYNEVYEDGFRGKHARITKNNIVNLNKKLLGRYQIEFFCLRCLCEELDCTEWEMYEKMQSFKEQGCELF